ncbi:MAG: prolipoprotein diacylglyceryl transferase [Saprospiraceae bacterium]|nr:prolipoprotein diacylglyceryl transferase [Saprospiraceae bacterium]
MYPDLSYLLHDLIGTPVDNWTSVIKMFGFLLVFAFLASHYFFRKELLRKEEQGLLTGSLEKFKIGFPPTVLDTIINALIGFIMGFKAVYLVQNHSEIGTEIFPFLASARGNWPAGILLALLFGGLYWYNKNKEKLDKPQVKEVMVMPSDRSFDITVRAAISSIIGAKIFAIFESVENVKAFLSDPIGQFFSGSGLAVLGGLIVAFGYCYWWISSKGITPIHVMDAFAPSFMMGYAVGRIGCQLSGDGDWGIVNTAPPPAWWFFPEWLWAFDYPRNVLEKGIPIAGCEGIYCNRLREPVYPTPVYETVVSLLIFGLLWIWRKRVKVAGMIFCIYLVLSGVERFYIEKIRVNDKIPMFGMEVTQAEIISVIMVILGIVGMFLLHFKKVKTIPINQPAKAS